MRLQNLIKSGAGSMLGGLFTLIILVSACTGGDTVAVQTVAVEITSSSVSTSRSDEWVPEVVAETTPSIVQVSVRRSDGVGNGTGIVLDASGKILTNWHIVEGANGISVELSSGQRIDASLMREDPTLDLAVLTVEAQGLVPAKFGDSSVLRVGQDVVSIGHAFGLSGGPSVSRGVVSALNRTVADANGNIFKGLIQTDAAINLGSSGGALLNAEGEVIGVNVGSLNVGQGANFALNINTVAEGADRLVALGEREQPGYLGLGGVDVTAYLAFQRALPVSEGFGVRYVDPESPAAADFQVDDIIVSIDDTPIRGVTDFTEFLRTHPDGTEVVVKAVRGAGDSAVVMEIPVTLGSPGA